MEIDSKLSRRAFLERSSRWLGAGALAAEFAGCGRARLETSAALREHAAAAGLSFGAAVQSTVLDSDREFAELVAAQCSMIVAENELKWRALRPTPEAFDFARADRLFEFAASRGLRLRGHNLTWGEALPTWFESQVDRARAEALLVEHVRTVVGRYRGRVHSWDVVNEAIEPNDGRADRLRTNAWFERLGERYLDVAFAAAKESDPNALLVYNDWDVADSSRDSEARRDGILRLLEGLLRRGVPVEAYGCESHLDTGAWREFEPARQRAFLAAVAALGLKILVTELDVADRALPADVLARDAGVASVMREYLDCVLDERAVIAVLNWGLSDRYTWLAHFKPRADALAPRPLPYDAALAPKLARTALVEAFAHRAARA